MSMEKLYQSVVWLQASSRVSELHFTNRMQIRQNMFFSTCWAGGKAQQEVEEKRCEWISCKLERHIFPLTKSVPIRHQITSTLRITRCVQIDICEGQGISKKATRCCQAKRLISLVRSAWFRPILDWLWRKSKSDCFRRSHLASNKVNADQDIGEGQCWG